MTFESKTAQVEASDVIRLILQFLKESNLKRSLNCLQEESGIALQSVDNLEVFRMDIMKGKWDSVITAMGMMYLPEEVLYLVYEHIVCELIESRNYVAAQTLLGECVAFKSLKVAEPSRYQKLEMFLSHANTTNDTVRPKDLYGGTTKDKRRATIWKTLSRHVQQAPSSRLLTLLGMALKWQNAQGLLPSSGREKSLYESGIEVSGTDQDIEEPRVTRIARTVKFGRKSPAQCVAFSCDGRYLTTGSTDGLIEIWDWTTGALSLDFEFQKKECFMAHDAPVLALSYNMDFTLLATGSSKGDVKLWLISSGECIAKFPQVHSDAISCIAINSDNSQILTGSFDSTARLHGIRSKSTLRQFSGHTSYITAAIFYGDGNRILTGSTDGNIKLWDSRTSECLLTFSPPCPNMKSDALTLPINSIILPPKSCSCFPEDSFFVCTKSTTVYLMNDVGQVLKKFSPQLGENSSDFVTLAISPKGRWIYVATEDHTLYTFHGSGVATQCESSLTPLNIHDQDILGLVSHPFDSVLASVSFDGNMHILQP